MSALRHYLQKGCLPVNSRGEIFDLGQKVFMALTSVLILGRRLNMAQWCSLLVISSALLLSTVAEGKGGKKGSLAVMVGGM